jgi:hypothetical protein
MAAFGVLLGRKRGLAYRLRDYPRPSAAREGPRVRSNGLAPMGGGIRPRWCCYRRRPPGDGLSTFATFS